MDAATGTAMERFRTVLDLFDAGVELMRCNLRRRLARGRPELDETRREALVEERLREWLQERPGAEHGDGWGRPGSWPRRTRG